MAAWTPEQDAILLRLRDKDGLTFSRLCHQVGKTKQGCISRYHRLKGNLFPSEVIREPGKGRPKNYVTHVYRDLKPAKHPYAPDSSCPDFAYDDLHCEAVLAVGAFPILNLRSAA